MGQLLYHYSKFPELYNNIRIVYCLIELCQYFIVFVAVGSAGNYRSLREKCVLKYEILIDGGIFGVKSSTIVGGSSQFNEAR